MQTQIYAKFCQAKPNLQKSSIPNEGVILTCKFEIHTNQWDHATVFKDRMCYMERNKKKNNPINHKYKKKTIENNKTLQSIDPTTTTTNHDPSEPETEKQNKREN